MARKRTQPLNRDRVLRAAVALADEGGIESLSMRRLADKLGVKAMSLYNHVANKDDLLDGILDAALGEVAVPEPGTDWKARIRALAISVHETLLRHSWAAGRWMAQRPGPARLRYGNALLGAFREAGFSKDVTYHAYHIMESYILGFTFQVLGYRSIDPEQFQGLASSFLSGELAAEYPWFTEHAQQHFQDEEPDGVDGYELGLDLILAGLEPLREG